tara:strand:- start:6484 stop:7050 length:567 start_codon:yes stop_codon:yes gene_type:complete
MKNNNISNPNILGINKIMTIILFWVLIQFIFCINEYCHVKYLIQIKQLSGSIEFWPGFFNSLIINTLSVVVGTYILVMRLPYKQKQRLLKYGVVGYGILFILSYLAVLIGVFIILYINSFFRFDFDEAFYKTISTWIPKIKAPSFFISIIFWGILVMATQFMFEVNDKFGQGVLWKFIKGRYNNPIEE